METINQKTRQKRTPKIRPDIRRILHTVLRLSNTLDLGQVIPPLGMDSLIGIRRNRAGISGSPQTRLQDMDENRPRTGLD